MLQHSTVRGVPPGRLRYARLAGVAAVRRLGDALKLQEPKRLAAEAFGTGRLAAGLVEA